MLRVLLTTTLVLLAGCADMLLSGSETSEARGLVLGVEASAREISPGDTLRLLARLTNTNARTVQLSFGSGCQIMIYIEDAHGEPVEPAGGGWICTAAITHLTLPGGRSIEREFLWTGTSRRYGSAGGHVVSEPLPSGTYQAYVRLERALIEGPREAIIRLRTSALPIVLR